MAAMAGDDLKDLERAALKLSDQGRRELAMQMIWSLPREDVKTIINGLSERMRKDILAALPAEISHLILVNLSLEDILTCTLVSRTWAERCRDQALWAMLCLIHDPPLRPAYTTWSDVRMHRQLMHSHIAPSTQYPDEGSSGSDSERDAFDPLTAQGGLGGGGGMAPVPGSVFGTGGHRALRRSVYERNGPGSTLPLHYSSRRNTPIKRTGPPAMVPQPPILSDLDTPDIVPQVNYKQCYIVNQKLVRRMRNPYIAIPSPFPSATPRTQRLILPNTLDAIGSMEAGGLAGHSEIIYALDMVRHRMKIRTPSRNDDDEEVDPYDTIMNLSGLSRAMPRAGPGRDEFFEGRDWLLSGSRDKTVRLWALSTTRPRVVKVFHGGHDGSVLSLFAVKMVAQGNGQESTLWVVSAGSDGKICLWDAENGLGDKPTRSVQAHMDSVLCVRGNKDKILSCSKDQTIKVWSMPDLTELLRIDIGDANSRATVNAVAMSDDYIVSGGGDKFLRVWDIRTGEQLASIEAHARGIASVSADFHPSPGISVRSKEGDELKATIVTGSSDASINTFILFADSSSCSSSNSSRLEAPLNFSLQPLKTCKAPCSCPPGLSRMDQHQCGRCLNRGHTELVRGLHINRDVFLSASYDGTARIWDRATGRSLAELTGGHTGRIFSVVGDRTRVITSGMDCRITIWNFGQGLDTSFIEP